MAETAAVATAVVATTAIMATMSKKSSQASGHIETIYGPAKLEVKGPHYVIAGKDSKTIYVDPGAKIKIFQSAGIPPTIEDVVEVLDDSPEKKRASFNSPDPVKAVAKKDAPAEAKDAAAAKKLAAAAGKKVANATEKKAAKAPAEKKAKQAASFKTPPTKSAARSKKQTKPEKKAASDNDDDSSDDSLINDVSNALDASNIEPKSDDKLEVAASITTSRPKRRVGRGKAKKGGSD